MVAKFAILLVEKFFVRRKSWNISTFRACPQDVGPLQMTQNEALRALQFKNRFYPINEMHKEFQILKVADIVEYKISKIIHSLLTSSPKLPDVLQKLIVPTNTIHNRNTRNRFQIYSKREKRPIGKRQIKCKPSQNWNNYPEYIRLTQTSIQNGFFRVETGKLL